MKKIDKKIIVTTYLYLLVPIIIQILYWINWYLSIPIILVLILGLYKTINNTKYNSYRDFKKIICNKKFIFIIIILSLINIVSGAGGFVNQNWDYNGRNAIFHDLVSYRWPVEYNYTNLPYESSIFGDIGILNYYFAYWLPVALLGKVTNFSFANVFLYFWQLLGTIMFFYLVFRYMKRVKIKYLIVFLLFGGLDIVAYIILNKYTNSCFIFGTHIDTVLNPFCMSTFITQLFFVFNQSLPMWIAIMLFLQDKSYKNCGYLFALTVPFSPFPMLGFAYVILVYVIFGTDLNSKLNKARIKELLSFQNFAGILAILPILYTYTFNISKKGFIIIDAIKSNNLERTLLLYLLFIILEFLVYFIIINKKNFKTLIMCFVFFAIAPLFYLGGGADLGNRSTIPLLIILYLEIIKFIDNKDKYLFRNKILCVILLIAGVTNFFEIYRPIKNSILYGNQLADNYKSFDNFENKEVKMFITNFISSKPNNRLSHFIYRY